MDVTLTFPSVCDVSDGVDVHLDLLGVGVNPSSYELKAAPPPAADKPHWSIMAWGFLIGIAIAAIACAFTIAGIAAYNATPATPDSSGGSSSAPPTTPNPLPSTSGGSADSSTPPDDSPRLRWGTELTGLGTSWSFTDNWVSSVTIGSGVLVALLASSDVLTAVLGSEPKAALSLFAVTGALAAIFVSLGPLCVKLVGPSFAVPSVGSTLVAAFVTLVGTMGQIAVVTWQSAELVSGATVAAPVVIGVVVALIVFSYAIRALLNFIVTGSIASAPAPSDVLTAADRVAAAIRGETAAEEEARVEMLHPVPAHRLARNSLL